MGEKYDEYASRPAGQVEWDDHSAVNIDLYRLRPSYLVSVDLLTLSYAVNSTRSSQQLTYLTSMTDVKIVGTLQSISLPEWHNGNPITDTGNASSISGSTLQLHRVPHPLNDSTAMGRESLTDQLKVTLEVSVFSRIYP